MLLICGTTVSWDIVRVLRPATPGQALRLDLWRENHRETIEVVAEVLPDAEVDRLAESLMGLALWHAVGWLERHCLAWKAFSAKGLGKNKLD